MVWDLSLARGAGGGGVLGSPAAAATTTATAATAAAANGDAMMVDDGDAGAGAGAGRSPPPAALRFVHAGHVSRINDFNWHQDRDCAWSIASGARACACVRVLKRARVRACMCV